MIYSYNEPMNKWIIYLSFLQTSYPRTMNFSMRLVRECSHNLLLKIQSVLFFFLNCIIILNPYILKYVSHLEKFCFILTTCSIIYKLFFLILLHTLSSLRVNHVQRCSHSQLAKFAPFLKLSIVFTCSHMKYDNSLKQDGKTETK